MNALSLFSGIGGLDIAAEWAGFKTVAFCERDKFCKSVLAARWPNVRIYDDVRTIDTRELPAIELVHGGYPCQPFSHAGKREGRLDERHLWPAMRRVVRDLRPAWVVGENVVGHVTLGLDDVLRDLEEDGYEARAFVFEARAVGAPHGRYRTFIVANADRRGRSTQRVCESVGRVDREAENNVLPVAQPSGIQGHIGWEAEPGVRRVVDGVPSGVDRLRALGNAVVPQQAYPIFAAIAETYNAIGQEPCAAVCARSPAPMG